MKFSLTPIPKHLQPYVECIRTMHYDAESSLAINVMLNGLPGIVFQHHEGASPIDNITTRSGMLTSMPTLYVYGQMTQPGVMNHKPTPFTSTQIVLKPHGLQTLLGVNASVLTNAVVDLAEFSAEDLNPQLIDTRYQPDRIGLLLDYLSARLEGVKSRDMLVEQSLWLIQQRTATITIRDLLETLNISERQFEKRFTQTVGITPHFYMRIRRFNEAIRLMKTGSFDRLTEVAYRLNFHDQSHFIRDIKAFADLTPKILSQKVGEIELSQGVMAYV